MYENLLALHSVDQFNEEFITVDDVYEATIMLDSPTAQSQTKRIRFAAATSADPELDFQWLLQEGEFLITMEVDGWNLGSVQSYNHLCSSPHQVCAKDHVGKTYWI